MDFLKIKCFLLDMDGTVYLSDAPIFGAGEAIERMRKSARVYFLTNNTSKSRLVYVDKLQKMGIKAELNDIYTAATATIAWIKARPEFKKIFLLGTDALKTEFLSEGIDVVDSNPDLVVIGYDTSLVFSRLDSACRFIRKGAPFIATHPDINCPHKGGEYAPDVGSFLKLIEASTGKFPTEICGKPNKPMGDAVKKLVGLEASQIAMVGDRLNTDMAFAINNGFKAVLVLSGEATKADLDKSGLKVDAVLNGIADILN